MSLTQSTQSYTIRPFRDIGNIMSHASLHQSRFLYWLQLHPVGGHVLVCFIWVSPKLFQQRKKWTIRDRLYGMHLTSPTRTSISIVWREVKRQILWAAWGVTRCNGLATYHDHEQAFTLPTHTHTHTHTPHTHTHHTHTPHTHTTHTTHTPHTHTHTHHTHTHHTHTHTHTHTPHTTHTHTHTHHTHTHHTHTHTQLGDNVIRNTNTPLVDKKQYSKYKTISL